MHYILKQVKTKRNINCYIIYAMQKKNWISIPPWAVLGAVLILFPIFLFITIENIYKQKKNTTKLLVEKGAALIRSFEAGARTGWRGMMGLKGVDFKLQRLLSETAQQSDIAYIIITNMKGEILAHSEPSMIGKVYVAGIDMEGFYESKKIAWREVLNPLGKRTFEVYRHFSPSPERIPGHRGFRGMMFRFGNNPFFKEGEDFAIKRQLIFVGLDMGPIEEARAEEMRHSIIMAFVLLLIGLAGVLLLFLAHAYKTTKTSLTRVKALSDKLIESMPVGLLAIDNRGKIFTSNETAESILGISADEASDREITDILPDDAVEVLEKLRNEDRVFTREIEYAGDRDNKVPLDMIAANLKSENGDSMGYLVIFRDLSEIRSLQKEIETNRRMASIGRLAAGVAHEIRNPLSSIKGFATYFKERYKEIPEDKKTAEIMIHEVERLNRVISQLLEFARPMELKRTKTSLPPLIEDTLRLVEADIKAKDIKIDIEGLSTNEASIDTDRIRQVLLNLYLNAIESMERSGILSISVHKDEKSRLFVVEISDTGSGISDEDLPHIFDPYFTTKKTGTGLGLAIVRKIMESHGGEIEVTGNNGNGTTVRITLPDA